MLDVFTIHSSALPMGTRVVGFRGAEGISRLYAFEIHVTLGPDAADAFELSSAVGAKGTLVLDRQDGGPPFAFHGVFSEVSLVHHDPDGRALVRAVLVPRLWRLTQTQHSRIFTGLSISDIIKKTLDDGGLTSADYRLQLSREYPVEEHVCQYRESHFDFFSRWMEREGLYYFFEQGDDGEKLIIADSKSAHDDLAPTPVRFFALSGADASAGECLQTFVCRHRALPASVRFKDYDYAKPALDVSGSAPVSKAGLGEISVHGARFFTPEAGKRLAQLRAEEILSREQVFTASGTAFYLRAGYTFALQDHPRSGFDAKYLVIEVEHYGNQAASTPDSKRLTGLAIDETYHVDVTAIPATVQFRAEARTTWPRIYGTEHGIVDGEADSEYAQLDDHGRYAVRFAFDESDLGDGKASTRVRMMQPHGGGTEGWHFPLRKGTEVLFTFLGGDPDRPVIAGVVPNAHTPSPVNKANHTRNVLQTGGRNRIELEDKAGFERITLSTPHKNSMIRMGSPNADHEMILRTDGNALIHCEVLDLMVYADLDETCFGQRVTSISKGRNETIWGGGMTHNVVGTMFQKVTGARVQEVSGTFSHKVKAAVSEEYGSYDLTCGPVQENCGDGTFVYKSVHVSSGPIEIKAPSVTINAPNVTINGANVAVKGSSSHKGFTAKSVEGFGSKNAIGVHKYDITGLKMEASSGAIARFGFKCDMVGFKAEQVGFKNQIGADAQKAPLSLRTVAISIGTFGFKKL